MFMFCPLCNCRTLSRAYKNIYYYMTVCSRQRKQIWLLKKISILNWFPRKYYPVCGLVMNVTGSFT